MAPQCCNGNTSGLPRFYIVCRVLLINFSFTAVSNFAAALPTIWTYRIPQVHWTGRWVETVATVTIGVYAIIFLALFCFSRGKVLPRNLIAVHSVYLGFLIECMVLTCSAGGSKLWKPTPDSGEFWEMWKAGEQVYLECDTLSRKGANCGVGKVKNVSNLQIVGITFLSATLFMDIIMLVLLLRANFDDMKQKWRGRMERWHGRHSISSADTNDSLTYANAIPVEEKGYDTVYIKRDSKFVMC